ncbi:MAG: phage holin, LLH family [Firmicutes bacterium]|nr:phage holin, LLH family [Bacillota bacterium]
MNETTFQIAELLVRIGTILVIAVLIPAAQKWMKDKQIDGAVRKAVYAAQQLLWAQDGKTRKKFAVNLATELLEKAGITINEGQLSALVEAAVQEMHIARGDYKEIKDDGTAE